MRKSLWPRKTLVPILAASLATGCAAPPPASPEVEPAAPPADAAQTEATVVEPVLDLSKIETPFDRPLLDAAFVRTERIRAVRLRVDRRTEKAWLRGVEHERREYDEAGRLLRESTREGDHVVATKSYRYDGERLVYFERTSATGGTGFTRYEHDGEGRVTQTITEGANEPPTIVRYQYEAGGRQIVHVDGEAPAVLTKRFEGGRLVRETLEREPPRPTLARTRSYDAEGRLTTWTSDDGRGRLDTLRFGYDTAGRLVEQTFHENDKPIYQRRYNYDQRGLVIREELESFVPAMGHGEIFHYEYERHGDPPSRRATFPEATPKSATVLAAVVAAFPGAYADLAKVTYQQVGPDQVVVEAARIFVPEAIVLGMSTKQLEEGACASKKALGYGCDCEEVSLEPAIDHAWASWPDKRVVPLTLHLRIGC